MSTTTPTSERLFKFLNEDGTPCHGGSGIWSLPADGRPGDWMPAIKGRLIPCAHGYHLCRPQDLLDWSGPALFEAQYRGQRIDSEDKVIVRAARLMRRIYAWNGQTMRLWACDCAERVLPIYEREVPGETRVRAAIDVARRFAACQATKADLAGACLGARASSATTILAVRYAALAASEAALGVGGYRAAWSAARYAGWVASRVPGWEVKGSEGWAAEQQWQLDRLMEYLDQKIDLPPIGHCHE